MIKNIDILNIKMKFINVDILLYLGNIPFNTILNTIINPIIKPIANTIIFFILIKILLKYNFLLL
jgi:hypothetical protein